MPGFPLTETFDLVGPWRSFFSSSPGGFDGQWGLRSKPPGELLKKGYLGPAYLAPPWPAPAGQPDSGLVLFLLAGPGVPPTCSWDPLAWSIFSVFCILIAGESSGWDRGSWPSSPAPLISPCYPCSPPDRLSRPKEQPFRKCSYMNLESGFFFCDTQSTHRKLGKDLDDISGFGSCQKFPKIPKLN